jgi:hypothetical protein
MQGVVSREQTEPVYRYDVFGFISRRKTFFLCFPCMRCRYDLKIEIDEFVGSWRIDTGLLSVRMSGIDHALSIRRPGLDHVGF